MTCQTKKSAAALAMHGSGRGFTHSCQKHQVIVRCKVANTLRSPDPRKRPKPNDEDPYAQKREGFLVECVCHDCLVRTDLDKGKWK